MEELRCRKYVVVNNGVFIFAPYSYRIFFMPTVFNNCAATVANFINQTRTHLCVAVCWFTHPRLFQLLQKAAKSGIRIQVVVNHDQVNFHPKGLDFIGLQRLGAEIFAYGGPNLLHYKFAVSDHKRVLTGSYNWTKAEQLDCLTTIECPDTARDFLLAFREATKSCQTLNEIRDIPPKIVHFSSLFQPRVWTANDLKKRIISGAKLWLVRIKDEATWDMSLNEMQHILMTKHHFYFHPKNGDWDDLTFQKWLSLAGLGPSLKNLLHRYCSLIEMGDILVAILADSTLLGAGVVASEPRFDNDRFTRHIQWIPVLKRKIIQNEPPKGPLVQPFKGAGMAIAAML